jgi:hypothetical protein
VAPAADEKLLKSVLESVSFICNSAAYLPAVTNHAFTLCVNPVCPVGRRMTYQRHDGGESGDARVSGHVSPKGAVYVHVSSSNGSGVGSGRLSRSSGGGHFRGSTSNGPCAGTWSAQRTG